MRWAQAGFSVIIGSRDASRAERASEEISRAVGSGARVSGSGNADAVAEAETVVLTVPFSAQIATLKGIETSLRPGHVLIDCTVPLATAIGGRPTALLGVWQGSAAQQAASAIPKGVVVVAAFHQVSAHHLHDLAKPVECDVLVCGDSRDAKDRVQRLVEAIDGCRYVDAGPLANARIVESLSALLIGINIRHKVPGAGIRLTGI